MKKKLTKQQEKERNKLMCECGHTMGEHSFVESFRCLRVMSCKCKGFKKEIKK